MKSSPNSPAWRSRYGPWAVVTGASNGIGRELARRLAASELNVVLVARRRERLDQLAEELAAEHAIDTLVVDADLGDRSGVERLVRETIDLDVGLLAASAGFGTSVICITSGGP